MGSDKPTFDPLLRQEIVSQNKRGVLVLISGPSGAGKDTVMNLAIQKGRNITHFVTTTTRAKRPGEVDGKDYHFISRRKFESLIGQDAFFEWVEYRGHLYGGQKKHLEQTLSLGQDVIWRLDVKGVKNIKDKVKKTFPRSATVFITAPSMEDLIKRLRQRDGDQDNWQKWNLDMAAWETKQIRDFDYLIINRQGQPEAAADQLLAIINSLRLKLIL